jgi:uncharacterized membrane protein YdbT with pleckstrin-like domain
LIRELVYRLLKVPPRPHVPPGAGDVVTFRAGERFFTYQQVKWALAQFSALFGLIVTTYYFRQPEIPLPFRRVLLAVESIAWVTFVVQIPFSYMIRRLDFELRWYIVTDRSLRIRDGAMTVREKTMTFANIQNMTVRQGPIQRLLNISDLEVRTAGGGATRGAEGGKGHHHLHEDLHVAYFRGVDDAAEIRDLIRERARRHRDSGLGDPDEPAHVDSPARSSSAVAAAKGLLAEVQQLRGALTSPRGDSIHRSAN